MPILLDECLKYQFNYEYHYFQKRVTDTLLSALRPTLGRNEATVDLYSEFKSREISVLLQMSLDLAEFLIKHYTTQIIFQVRMPQKG